MPCIGSDASWLRPESVRSRQRKGNRNPLANFDMPVDFKRNYFDSNLAMSSAIP